MLRHNVTVRRDLDRIAADNGFDFHIIDNEIYWDESRAYRFTLRQIEEQIEKPTAELHQMCLEVVDRAVKDEEILTQLAIPPLYWDVIAESWRARDPSLYGRMDFAWCGNAPVKLLSTTLIHRPRCMSRLISSGCGWKTPGVAALFRVMPISTMPFRNA